MSEQRDNIRILDIMECIRRIEEFTSEMDYDLFLKDIKTQDAVVRNLEIIGEAAKNLSDTFKMQKPETSWREISRLRDRLIHHYSGINFDVVWGIIQNDIPKLKKDIS